MNWLTKFIKGAWEEINPVFNHLLRPDAAWVLMFCDGFLPLEYFLSLECRSPTTFVLPWNVESEFLKSSFFPELGSVVASQINEATQSRSKLRCDRLIMS